MQTEMGAMESNNTWTLSLGNGAICSKWIYKIKYRSSASMERYKARLVAKRYTQQEGI